MTDIEIRLLRLIPLGSERPINGKELARLLGINERTVRELISRLIIRHGVPIVAKRGIISGHYIPLNDTERLEGIKELRSQHQAESKRLDALIMADLKRRDELLRKYSHEEMHDAI